VRDLSCGVNSGIGTARANDQNPMASKNRCEGLMELALHRLLVTLFLPTVKRLTVIGDLELQPTRHCGHPRTKNGIGR
jgi:hypothetical protein